MTGKMILETIKILLVEDKQKNPRKIDQGLENSNEARFQITHISAKKKFPTRFSKKDFDVILLFLSLKDRQDLDSIARIHTSAPDIPLIVLKDQLEKDFVHQALQRGAEVCFTSESCQNELFVWTLVYIVEHSRKEEKIKKKEETLQKELDLLKVVIDGIPDPIYVKDLQGRYLMINTTSARNIGKPVKEIIGKSDNGLISPETVAKFTKDDQKVIESGQVQTFEAKFTTAGTNKIFLTTKAPYRDHEGKIIGLFGISRDITQLKLIEEKIRSEHSFRKAIEDSILAGMSATDLNGRLIYVNPAFCRMVGWTAEELLGSTPPFVYWPPEESENIMKIFKGRLHNMGPREVEYVFCRRNGERFPISVLISPLTDGHGQVIGMVASFHDLTDRKQADAEIRRTNQMLQGLVQACPLAILVLDLKGKVRVWNPAAERIFGWSEKEVLGKVFPGVPDDLIEEFYANLKAVSQGKSFAGHELLRQKKGGIPIHIQVWTVPWSENQDDPLCLSIISDITEKRKMEEELAKVQKLESLGLLAGGIAHDFNNILTGILGNISLAKTWMNPDDQAFHRLNEAEKASHRATELAGQLLTFAKGGAPIKKPGPILGVLENSVKFALRGSNILSEFSFQKDLWLVEMDEGQIGQVVQNLAINAQQAMPVGGTIQVKARNRVITEDKVEGLSLRKGNYVEISIQDQGSGIPKELLSKIFDPYFSTKQKGSGLGLAISHSIIKRHDGFISVKSKIGKGTTFFVFLPASLYAVAPRNEGKEEFVKGKEKVLIMDDEESILSVAGEMLRYLGYEVETSLSGTKTLEKYKKAKESGKPFDIVITDLTIPGDIGGIEVLKRLKKMDSEVKVIVSSGYSNDPAIANFKSYGFSDYIAKPYRMIDMSQTLQKVAKRKR